MELRTGGAVTAAIIPLIIRQTYGPASPADSLIGTGERKESVSPKQVPLYFIPPILDPSVERRAARVAGDAPSGAV